MSDVAVHIVLTCNTVRGRGALQTDGDIAVQCGEQGSGDLGVTVAAVLDANLGVARKIHVAQVNGLIEDRNDGGLVARIGPVVLAALQSGQIHSEIGCGRRGLGGGGGLGGGHLGLGGSGRLGGHLGIGHRGERGDDLDFQRGVAHGALNVLGTVHAGLCCGIHDPGSLGMTLGRNGLGFDIAAGATTGLDTARSAGGGLAYAPRAVAVSVIGVGYNGKRGNDLGLERDVAYGTFDVLGAVHAGLCFGIHDPGALGMTLSGDSLGFGIAAGATTGLNTARGAGGRCGLAPSTKATGVLGLGGSRGLSGGHRGLGGSRGLVSIRFGRLAGGIAGRNGGLLGRIAGRLIGLGGGFSGIGGRVSGGAGCYGCSSGLARGFFVVVLALSRGKRQRNAEEQDECQQNTVASLEIHDVKPPLIVYVGIRMAWGCTE